MDTQNQAATPLISFIVTTYNLPVTLLQSCLESIMGIALNNDEREIIVVDDGSDSSCEGQLKAICPELQYIRQDNQGLSVARNTGVAHAKGEYIQYVDGDDMLIKTAYDQCVSLIKSLMPDVLMFKSTSRQATGRKSGVATLLHPQVCSGAEYMLHNNLRAAAWGYIHRRSIAQTTPFTPGRLHEDEEYTPQILLKAVTMTDTRLKAYFYRKRPSSITNTPDIQHIENRLDHTFQAIKRLQAVPTEDGQQAEAMSRRIAQLTMDMLYNDLRLTHSVSHMKATARRLADARLLPLPEKPYTCKYLAFAKLVNRLI